MSDEMMLDTPDLGAEVVEQPEVQEQEQQEQEPESGGSKFSKDFSNWLKSLKDGGDPNVSKFARYGKDLEGRDRALRELFPNGVNDVREVKATLDALQHGDLKGIEAIGAMQDAIRETEQVDSMIASGDPKVLDLFGEEFNEGLGKLAPAILDRIQQANPQAYNAAVLPQFVNALRSSPLVAAQNALAQVLEEQPPRWLTENQKAEWINDKLTRAVQHNNAMADWLNQQANAAKDAKLPPANNGRQAPASLDQERQQFEAQQRDFHWKTNIAPQLDQHASKTFDQLFRPYNIRLKLDAPAQERLKQDFVSRVVEKAAQNRQYMAQIGRYRQQRTPDANAVLNVARVEFDKHSKGVINELVNERYRTFLGSKQNPTPQNSNGQQRPAPQNGVTIVSVKPPMSEIDHKNTPLDWIHQGKYRLRSGKVVQVQR